MSNYNPTGPSAELVELLAGGAVVSVGNPLPTTGGGTGVPLVVTVGNPAAGANWSYTLLAPGRLVAFNATFTCAVAAATRFPIIQAVDTDLITDISLTPAGLTASQVGILSAFPAAPLTSAAVLAATAVCTAPFPNVLLPAGAVIDSFCYGIQAADQWSSISLCLSAT